jgi:hypothetical protein
MALGGAKENMNFFHYFSKFSVHLLIPYLRLDQFSNLHQKPTTDKTDFVILVVTCLEKCLQDALLVMYVQGHNCEDAGLAPHFVNVMSKLAKLFFYFL